VVENGDRDASHGDIGQVRVNGEEVMGRRSCTDLESKTVEVGLREGENEVQVGWKDCGSTVRIGIEEPAQTVTVTEVPRFSSLVCQNWMGLGCMTARWCSPWQRSTTSCTSMARAMHSGC